MTTEVYVTEEKLYQVILFVLLFYSRCADCKKKITMSLPIRHILKAPGKARQKEKKKVLSSYNRMTFFLLLTCSLWFKFINTFDSLEMKYTHVFFHHRGVICVWATMTDGHPCISPPVRAIWIWCNTYWLMERQSMLKIVMGTHPCATLYASGKTQTITGWCVCFFSAY